MTPEQKQQVDELAAFAPILKTKRDFVTSKSNFREMKEYIANKWNAHEVFINKVYKIDTGSIMIEWKQSLIPDHWYVKVTAKRTRSPRK